jgi:hypothetical protein
MEINKFKNKTNGMTLDAASAMLLADQHGQERNEAMD